ncbi:MAG TPA: hypothetical protein VGG03_20515, partial [Thermoanaerobaculia bacterium]
MPKRLAALLATLGASALMLALLPLSAQAAPSPWWQVLTSTHPTKMWEPTDNVQEIDAELAPFGIFAAKIEVAGDVIGCLGTGEVPGFFTADSICESETSHPADETAAELEATLEGAYGPTVEVSGGPVTTAPFEVRVPRKSPPPVELTQLTFFGFPLGSAKTKTVSDGGSGELVLTITNLGDAPMDATGTPLTIVDELPEGVEATALEATAGPHEKAGPIDCEIEAADLVRCTYEGTLTSYDAIEIEVFASLTGEPPVAGAPGKVTVSGGNAPTATAVQEIEVGPGETPFGIDHLSSQAEEEGGGPATQAGGHPFQLTTTIQLNTGAAHHRGGPVDIGVRDVLVDQPALPRNLRFPLPAGLVGNAAAMPECDMQTFFDINGDLINECPDASAIGVASVTVIEPNRFGLVRLAIPLFNLPPAHGQPARFGFVAAGAQVVIDTKVVPEDRYRIVAEVRNITQIATFLSSTVVLWGAPGDPRHDSSRGWNCAYTFLKFGPCARPADLSEEAFLRQPVSCDGPLDFDMEAEPWNVPVGSIVERASFAAAALKACNKVPFNPSIAAAPSSKLAANPSGLEFRLDMPNSGLADKDAIAEGQPKKVEVTLPEGMTINAAQAEGLAVCSPEDYARERFDSKPGEGCPEASKIGEVQVSTPLLKEEPRGALYVAKPYDNPFGSLIALYLVARSPERGIIVKQAGVVKPDPKTGQLVTTFDDIPQLPFSTFKLRFREGGRAPLVTPPACGSFETVAKFTPWSATDPNNPQPNEIVTRTSSFAIERGVDGGACPSGGVPPFGPGFEAGSINPAAGRYSPFYMRLTRRDGEQDLTKFSATLPEGALAKLAGVSQCPQAAVDAAEGRSGLDEKASPSCPASSRIGHTTVGAGVGSILTYVPGELYLGGPYKG